MTNTGISEQVSLRCIQRFLPHLISSDLSADKVDFNKKVNPCVDSGCIPLLKPPLGQCPVMQTQFIVGKTYPPKPQNSQRKVEAKS